MLEKCNQCYSLCARPFVGLCIINCVRLTKSLVTLICLAVLIVCWIRGNGVNLGGKISQYFIHVSRNRCLRCQCNFAWGRKQREAACQREEWYVNHAPRHAF